MIKTQLTEILGITVYVNNLQCVNGSPLMVAPTFFMQASSAGWDAMGTFRPRSCVFLVAHSVEAMT
jgi:hypothetical protein